MKKKPTRPTARPARPRVTRDDRARGNRDPRALVSLLSAHTAMPVVQATEGLVVESNHVYVIPPNAHMEMRTAAGPA